MRTATSPLSRCCSTKSDGSRPSVGKTRQGRCAPSNSRALTRFTIQIHTDAYSARWPALDFPAAGLERSPGVRHCAKVDKQRAAYLGDVLHFFRAMAINGLPPTASDIRRLVHRDVVGDMVDQRGPLSQKT